MTWSDLIDRIALRTGLSKKDIRATLSALADVAVEALGDGDDVPLRGLCTLSSRRRGPRTIRDIRLRRRIHLDGRYVPRVRVSGRVRQILQQRTPQLWRDPEHQKAWRTAAALVGDLALYHADRAPTLDHEATQDAAESDCRTAFGPLWSQVQRSYEERIPAEIRNRRNYLALAALERWAP